MRVDLSRTPLQPVGVEGSKASSFHLCCLKYAGQGTPTPRKNENEGGTQPPDEPKAQTINWSSGVIFVSDQSQNILTQGII